MFVFITHKKHPTKIWWVVKCYNITCTKKVDNSQMLMCHYATTLSWCLNKTTSKNINYWPLELYKVQKYNTLEQLTEIHFIDLL